LFAGFGETMDTAQFLKRLEAGGSAKVWPDLIGLGASVFEEPFRSVALDICQEIVRRARFNLLSIHAKLLDLGYEFAEPESAVVDAEADASSVVDSFEAEFGAMPLIARVWYQTLASVNFSQAEHQCRSKQITAPAAPEIFGLGSHPVLVIQSLEHARAEAHRMNARRAELLPLYKKDYPDRTWDEESQFLALGTAASNCDPKGFTLPCVAIDGVIYNDGGGDTYFVDQLRSAFRWGGFPFWHYAPKNKKFSVPFTYRPNFEKLLPLLREGLVEL
jgi:hypothetical protein